MVMSKSLRFKYIEPLMFKGPEPFTPFVRGPQVRARSMLTPLPTTLVGALTTVLMDLKGLKGSKQHLNMHWVSEYYEALKEALNMDLRGKLSFQGPYITATTLNGNLQVYLPYSIEGFSDRLVALDELMNLVRQIRAYDLADFLGKLRRKLNDTTYSMSNYTLTGIKLVDLVRSAEEGYIYTAEFIEASNIVLIERDRKRDHVNIKEVQDVTEVDVTMDVRGEDEAVKELYDALKAHEQLVLGIGGERRIIKLSIEDYTFELRLKDYGEEHVKRALIYVISPALFKTSRQTLKHIKAVTYTHLTLPTN